MLEVKNTEVSNLARAIIKSGYPMDTGNMIEDFNHLVKCVEFFIEHKDQSQKDHEIAVKHIKRAVKLGNAKVGSGHPTFLSGIRVDFDLKYPEYISPQLQRYHWFDIISSQSKMHKLTKMNIKKACNVYVDDVVIKNLNKWIDVYNKMTKDGYKFYDDYMIEYGETIEEIEELYYDKNVKLVYNKYQVFMKIISNCPSGLEKWMGINTNYMQLKTIYLQRKHHKLVEDYGSLCSWIESLPLFKVLCLGEPLFKEGDSKLEN